MEHDHYGISPTYAARDANITVADEIDYWSPHTIRMARYYQYHVYQHARLLIDRYRLTSVLDIGCGPALKLTEIVAPVCRDITGLDDERIIRFCRETAQAGEYVSFDIERQPLPLERRFDLILSADVIEHLVDPDKLLTAIKQAAHRGSYIVLSTPERGALRGPSCAGSPKAVHVREWAFDEFARYLRSRGFKIVEHRVLPAMKFHFSRDYFRQWWWQARSGRGFNTCQMAVCQIQG